MANQLMNQRSTGPKLAYIDGGLAAILLQGAVGAVLAGLLYVKIYWQKVKAFFSRSAAPGTPKEGDSGS